jgi:protein-L-isoaspartate(D-aspartate) O-methyltransferase
LFTASGMGYFAGSACCVVMAEADGGETAARLRAEMVALLREQGSVSDPRVIAALETVPRHVFVPGSELAEAYDDRAIVTHLRDGVPTSSASQPAIVAIMLDQLHAPVGGSVLEIGAGTGYNAGLLATLVGPSGRVVTVDIDPEVAVEARAHLSEAGIANATVICGDGAMGRADGAPYDGIIVTAGVADLSPAWVAQLRPGGRLVAPLSIRGVPQSVALTRADDGHLRSVEACDAMFMPLTGAMAKADRSLPVPGHQGVRMHAPADMAADSGQIAAALGARGPAAAIGITASSREVFPGLRRWLAFTDPEAALLSYTGSSEGADASGVPAILDVTHRGLLRRASPCLVGPGGFAALDRAAPAAAVEGPSWRRTFELAVRGYGEAGRQTAKLTELAIAWDAAGRPGVDRLQIDAYPSSVGSPPGANLFRATHTTFAARFCPAPTGRS